MKRLSSFMKIILVFIIVMTSVRICPVQGAQAEEISNIDSINIIFGDTIPDTDIIITKDMFDLSKTDWIYVYYNSDGIPELGIIDKNFTGITLEPSMTKFVCSPKKGSATFYGDLLPDGIEFTANYFIPAVQCIDVNYYTEYEIYNSEQENIYFLMDGDYKVDYSITDINHNVLDSGENAEITMSLECNNYLIFKLPDKGDCTIENPHVGSLYCTTGVNNAVYIEKTVLEDYNATTQNTYNMDGSIYTIYNNANYDIDFRINGTIAFSWETYTAEEEIYESLGSETGEEQGIIIPAGGRTEIIYEKTEGETFTFKHYSIHESLLDVSIIKIPGEIIAVSGTYRLEENVMYSFGNGNWTVDDGDLTYNAGISFYVDKAGDYKLTVQ